LPVGIREFSELLRDDIVAAAAEKALGDNGHQCQQSKSDPGQDDFRSHDIAEADLALLIEDTAEEFISVERGILIIPFIKILLACEDI
jgi:hypothetical protein